MSTKSINRNTKSIYRFHQGVQGENRLFLHLKMKHKEQVANQRSLLTREIKNYNFMIDGQKFFDQPLKINLITYDNIRKIATG